MKLREFIRETISTLRTVKISPIIEEDIDDCLYICAISFSNVMAPTVVYGYLRAASDWKISVKAEYDGKIVGCYLLRKSNLKQFENWSLEDLTRYKNLKGVEGVALVVLPEYRNLDIGKKLREYPLTKDFDYIYGMHKKSLQNIDNWIKFGRRIIAETSSMYITLMDISQKAKKMTDDINKKKKDDLNESDFEKFHVFQNAGHTCGPTCIQMVLDYLKVEYDQIEDIIELCGCNTKTGTIDIGIKNALDSLGVKNKQNLFYKDDESSINYLDSILSQGNIFIMRTLTKGIKHWIIIYGKKNNKYLVADPWLGKILYSASEILKIWKPRDFDGFQIEK